MKRLAFAVLFTAVATVGLTSVTADAGSLAAPALSVHSSRYGKILFDGRGRVLYLFQSDRRGRSTCYGACAKAWPPYLVASAPKGLAGIDRKLVGTTKRKDGRLQVTYAKHPLYYFKEDTRPGQIKCQNISNFGGLWLVVAPSGRPVR